MSSCWVPPRSGQPPARARRAYGRHGRAGGGHEPKSIGSAPRPAPALQSTGACSHVAARLPATPAAAGAVAGPRGSLGVRSRRRGRRPPRRLVAGRRTLRRARSRCRTRRSRRCPGSTTRPCTRSSGTAASSGSTRSARAGGCCCTSARSTTGPRSGSTGSWSPRTRAGTPRSTPTSPTRSATGGDQVVVVRAEDPTDDLAQPRGKQDWRPEPHDIWYHRTTGIWQPVWLEVVGDRYLTGLDWTPDLVRGQVTLEAGLSGMPVRGHPARGPPHPIRPRCSPRPPSASAPRRRSASLDLPRGTARPGPGRPALVAGAPQPARRPGRARRAGRDGARRRSTATLGSAACGVGDGRFLLNGRPYYLRLVLEQGYWPESHLAAPDDDALRARSSWSRRWASTGSASTRRSRTRASSAGATGSACSSGARCPAPTRSAPPPCSASTSEWLEVVRRDRSHPCIVTWVPLNESWGVPTIAQDAAQRDYAAALYHLTRALDPTRPVICNDGWEHTAQRHPRRPRLRRARRAAGRAVPRSRGRRPRRRRTRAPADAGCCSRASATAASRSSSPSSAASALRPRRARSGSGTPRSQSAAEYLERFAGLVDALLDSPEIAGFCYTQLTDTEQERNGLLTEDRAPKLDPERIRAIVGRPARAVPSEEVDAGRAATLRTWASGARPPGRPSVSR